MCLREVSFGRLTVPVDWVPANIIGADRQTITSTEKALRQRGSLDACCRRAVRKSVWAFPERELVSVSAAVYFHVS